MLAENVEYAGFWRRALASLVDTVVISLVVGPLLMLLGRNADFGLAGAMPRLSDSLLHLLLPAAIVIGFWLLRQGTPGKLLLRAHVVDARTGQSLTPGQAIGRYLAYYLSMLPCFLGFFWVAFDGRKQGWHDKLAGTVVILEPKKKRASSI